MTYIIVQPDELYHHGILGQKWGVRRYQNEDGTLTEAGRKRYGYSMEPQKTDSSVTRKVKQNFNSMSDDEFRRKYGVSKARYEKRVRKYGDPYMNSPLAKAGKKLESARKNKYNHQINALQKDAKSFEPYLESGIRTKSGKLVMSPDEVSQIYNTTLSQIKNLENRRDRKSYSKYTEKRVNSLLAKSSNKRIKAISK